MHERTDSGISLAHSIPVYNVSVNDSKNIEISCNPCGDSNEPSQQFHPESKQPSIFQPSAKSLEATLHSQTAACLSHEADTREIDSGIPISEEDENQRVQRSQWSYVEDLETHPKSTVPYSTTTHNLDQENGQSRTDRLVDENGAFISENQAVLRHNSDDQHIQVEVAQPLKSNIDPTPSVSHTKGPDWPSKVPDLYTLFIESASSYNDSVAVASFEQKGTLYGLQNTSIDHEAYHTNPYVRWSFSEFVRGITRLADALQQKGACKGVPIFTFLSNIAEVPLIFWAAATLGCTLVPLSPQTLLNRDEASHVFRKALSTTTANTTFIFTQTSDLASKIISLDLPMLPTIVTVEAGDVTSHLSFADFISLGQDGDISTLIKNTDAAGDRRTIIFTSGTTALPKAVMFDSFQVNRWVIRNQVRFVIDVTDTALMYSPNNHAFYLHYVNWLPSQGATILLGGSTFSPTAFSSIMSLEEPTHMPAPPTLAQAMVQVARNQKLHLTSFKHILLAAAGISAGSLREVFQVLNTKTIGLFYGSTETGCLTSTGLFNDVDRIVRHENPSVGWAEMGAEIKICSPGSREPLPRNSEGEIHYGGIVIADGYVGDSQHEAFYVDDAGQKWYVTGDAGTMNEEDMVFLCGRVKDMIIRGGKNISPAAIEATLARNDLTKHLNVQIVSKLDAIAGEIPIAVSQRAVNEDDIERIQTIILENMGPVYLPGEILSLEQVGLEDFPRVALDKVSKSKLAIIVRKFLTERDEPVLVSQPTSFDTDTRSLQQPVASNTDAQSDEIMAKIKLVWKRCIGHDVKLDVPVAEFADSITMMRVHDRLSKDIGVRVSLSELVELKTVREQIALITKRRMALQQHAETSDPTWGLSACEMRYLFSTEKSFNSTKQFISTELSKSGLTWTDIHTITPASDFTQIFTQADICNSSWSWKFALCAKAGVSKQQLRQTMEVMLSNNKMATSYLFSNRTAFGSDIALHVMLQSTDKVFDLIFRDYGSVGTKDEFAKLVNNPYEHEMALLPGPLTQILLFNIEETGQTGAIWVCFHAWFDASYMQVLYEDLDRALEGATVQRHIPYKIWADSYHSLRTSQMAQSAVSWHAARLIDLHTYRTSVFPPLPRPHHFELSRVHHQQVDENGFHGTFQAKGLAALRQIHPTLSAPGVLKTAWSLMNMKRTGSLVALFSQLKANRKRFPFIPKILESLSPSHTFEAGDVAGITIQDVITMISLDLEESVIDLMTRITNDQEELNENAAAPMKSIMQDIGPINSEIMLDVFRSQVFNWVSGLGALNVLSPWKNFEHLAAFIRPSLRLVINVDVAGDDDETVFFQIKSPLFDTDGLRGIAEDFEDFTLYICNEQNWNKRSGNFMDGLRSRSKTRDSKLAS